MVEACNAAGCTLSVQQLIEGSLVDAIGYFKASNTGDHDEFGTSVSLSADGNTIALGVPGEHSAATGLQGYQGIETIVDRSGATYVFARGDGTWQQQAYVKASNSSEGFYFGSAVSLSANADTLAVGAINESNPASGVNIDQSGASLNYLEPGYKAGAVYLY